MADETRAAPEERVAAIVQEILGCRLSDEDRGRPLRRIGLDSAGMIELLLALESQFGLRIPDDDVVPDHFRSIVTIAAYVRSRI